MDASLKTRLLSLDKLQPFVWKLRISESEYNELKQFFAEKRDVNNREEAILAIIYIAEWYKREYVGNVSSPLRNISAKSLWQLSEWNSSLYVYKAEKNLRYLESIYVLGGLPMKYIMQRKDTKLLKSLCRIYKGEIESLEEEPTLEAGQAAAFRESILQQASLYEWLKALLLHNAEEVYAKEDLDAHGSLSNKFIEDVQNAYDEVMRDKFRIEWIVDYTSSAMQWMLRLRLRPEEMGGLHQYLRMERARTWNIPSLMEQRVLRVSLRFRKGGKVVGNEDTRRGLIRFENTGQEDTGFEAVGRETWAILRTLPTVPFDCIDVVITDDSDQEYTVQQFECKQEYIQLWAMPHEVNKWSSLHSGQCDTDTAVVFSDYYEISGNEYATKLFYVKSNGLSASWKWAYIPDYIQLQHRGDKPITLWNRNGDFLFAPKLYTNILRYRAGKVKYKYIDNPDDYSELDAEEWYSAIFRRSDIRVYHVASKEILNAQPEPIEIEKIEYKSLDSQNSAQYTIWDADNNPPYGRVKLRLTIRGSERFYTILYLPSMIEHGESTPVVRDFKNHKLRYVNEKNEEKDIQIAIPQDKIPLETTTALKVWEDKNGVVELDAILPTLIKEIYLDRNLVKYLQDGETFNLPYILKDRIYIHDYNQNGYSEFDGRTIGDLKERGSIDKWKKGGSIDVEYISEPLPKYIHLVYGAQKQCGVSKMIYWDYSKADPKEVHIGYDSMAEYSILFQDMREIDDYLDCIPPTTHNERSNDDWDNDNVVVEPDLLRCYNMAIKYKTYFFIFNPLFNIEKKDFIEKICKGLKENGRELSVEDWQNLKRCAIECGLVWDKIKTEINKI